MWRKYLEREDSRIGGKYTDKKIPVSPLPYFCLRSSEDCFPREPCFCLWLLELRQEQREKGDKHSLALSSPDLFVGQLKSSLTCTDCGYCSTVFDPFWDLSLPIAKVKVCPTVAPASASLGLCTADLDFFSLQRGYPEVTLMDCMRLFTKEDVLDGDEKPVSQAPQ